MDMTTETRTTELTPERAADLLDTEFADLARAQANYATMLANLEAERSLRSEEGHAKKLVELDAAMDKATATVRDRGAAKLDSAQA
jgi:hypothetical protein